MRKKVILIGLTVILITAAIIGAKVLIEYLENKEKSETFYAFNRQSAMGRWIVENEEFAFIVYMDDNQVSYIKTDLFFNTLTGEGMYNMPLGDFTGGLESPYGTENDYISVKAKSRPEKNNDCFEVVFKYMDKDDTITIDEDIFRSLVIHRDKEYVSLYSTVSDSFNQDGLELVISLLNDKLSDYYRSNIAIFNVEFNSGIWGEVVDFNGFISGTAYAKDLNNGDAAILDFIIEPVTDPMIFHSIINNTTGEVIVSDYVTSRQR